MNYASNCTDQGTVTTTTVVDWLDIFTRPLYKHIVVESLAYCQEQKGLEIYSWVLMTNHLHMIVGTHESHKIGNRDATRGLFV